MGQKKVRSSLQPPVDPSVSADDQTAAKEISEVDDEFLVRSAIDGDRSAFDTLVKRYQNAAVSVSYRLLGNRADAVEIAQDAFLKAFRSLATLERPGAFGGWLMRIVSNLSLNRRRGRHLRKGTSLEDDEGNPIDAHGATTSTGESLQAGSLDPERAAMGKELGAQLEKALAGLPEKQRLAILMFTIQELPQKQVAEALDCSVEAVKWHVFQGRKKLKELLKDHL